MPRKKDRSRDAEIVGLLEAGRTIRETCDALGVGEALVKDRKKEYGVGRRRRRFRVVESFFDDINTPEKAYFLGFVLADGHVSKHYLRISLHPRDAEVLEWARDAIVPNGVLKRTDGVSNYGDNPLVTLEVNSVAITNRLRELGLMSNKAKMATCPSVPPHLEDCFWRGVLDGDGTVTVSAAGQIGVSLTSNRPAAEAFSKYLNRFGLKARARHFDNYSVVSSNGNGSVLEAITTIYASGDFGLTRKRDLVLRKVAQLL